VSVFPKLKAFILKVERGDYVQGNLRKDFVHEVDLIGFLVQAKLKLSIRLQVIRLAASLRGGRHV
jgi:hypothetical protein